MCPHATHRIASHCNATHRSAPGEAEALDTVRVIFRVVLVVGMAVQVHLSGLDTRAYRRLGRFVVLGSHVLGSHAKIIWSPKNLSGAAVGVVVVVVGGGGGGW